MPGSSSICSSVAIQTVGTDSSPSEFGSPLERPHVATTAGDGGAPAIALMAASGRRRSSPSRHSGAASSAPSSGLLDVPPPPDVMARRWSDSDPTAMSASQLDLIMHVDPGGVPPEYATMRVADGVHAPPPSTLLSLSSTGNRPPLSPPVIRDGRGARRSVHSPPVGGTSPRPSTTPNGAPAVPPPTSLVDLSTTAATSAGTGSPLTHQGVTVSPPRVLQQLQMSGETMRSTSSLVDVMPPAAQHSATTSTRSRDEASPPIGGAPGPARIHRDSVVVVVARDDRPLVDLEALEGLPRNMHASRRPASGGGQSSHRHASHHHRNSSTPSLDGAPSRRESTTSVLRQSYLSSNSVLTVAAGRETRPTSPSNLVVHAPRRVNTNGGGGDAANTTVAGGDLPVLTGRDLERMERAQQIRSAALEAARASPHTATSLRGHINGVRVRGQGVARGRNVYIGNLPGETTDDMLRFLCGLYGAVENVAVRAHRDGTYFGFALMSTVESAAVVIQQLNGHVLEGLTLSARYATNAPQGGRSASRPGERALQRQRNVAVANRVRTTTGAAGPSPTTARATLAQGTYQHQATQQEGQAPPLGGVAPAPQFGAAAMPVYAAAPRATSASTVHAQQPAAIQQQQPTYTYYRLPTSATAGGPPGSAGPSVATLVQRQASSPTYYVTSPQPAASNHRGGPAPATSSAGIAVPAGGHYYIVPTHHAWQNVRLPPASEPVAVASTTTASRGSPSPMHSMDLLGPGGALLGVSSASSTQPPTPHSYGLSTTSAPAEAPRLSDLASEREALLVRLQQLENRMRAIEVNR